MQGLSNKDFRTILMTPRGTQAPTMFNPPAPVSKADKEKKRQRKLYYMKKMKEKQQKKPYIGQKTEKEDDDEEDNAPKTQYRDRAAERRQGANPDYNEDENLLSSFNAVPPPQQSAKDKEKAREEAIAKSKFLGGDMEHTHLVKGLDYALLKKVREEIERKKEEELLKRLEDGEEEGEDDEESKEPLPYIKLPTSGPISLSGTQPQSKTKSAQPVIAKKGDIKFSTAVAKSVYTALFEKNLPKKTDYFLPGRTVFVFDLSNDAKSELPTVMKRSKEDCPKVKECMKSEVDAEVLSKLNSILSYLKLGSKGKKRKKDEKTGITPDTQPQQTPQQQQQQQQKQGFKAPEAPSTAAQLKDSKPAVSEAAKAAVQQEMDDDDIFPDAGTYVPQLPDPKKQTQQQEKTVSSYFETKTSLEPTGDSFSKEELKKQIASLQRLAEKQQTRQEGHPRDDKDKGVPVVFKRDAKLDEELRKPKVTDVREKDPSYVGDSYAECYPGTYETSFLDNEASDDEDDIAKMDLGKKGKLHRWDFESEEAWSSYNDSREAMPKAAFQFGVKMSGGRKTKKHAPKQELKKFDKDLKKIQSMIKKRENEHAPNVPTAQYKRQKLQNDEE